ncbi:MAG: acyltransferase [Treponema sp.]|nr:acyltransferase [Treponema sp.]
MMPVVKAYPDVKTREPRISKMLLFFLKILARFYLFMFYGVARVVLSGEKELFAAFKRALEGKSRCIIAFRHPNGGEPQLLGWFFLFKLRRLAAKAGIKFNRFPHAIFVYGYEVVRWGGWVARYVMPNLGALPIHHSKFDRHGMSRIYQAIIDGNYPVALAPEGQVSYTTETVPRLEQGVIRIGFTAAERLAKKNDAASEQIPLEILPVAIHFRFGSWGRLTLEGLIKKIEKHTGVGGKGMPFTERLKASRDYILEENEERYGLKTDHGLSFEQRIGRVIDAALLTTEKILGVETSGDFFSRMYELRQIWWDRVVLPGVDKLKSFSRIKRGIMDLRAGEAWHAGRHLELVDLGWYFRGAVPEDGAPLHCKVEYAQNLWDFANRTMGGAYHTRTSIFPRRVIIQAAPPLNLTNRLDDYKKDKKAAIDTALSDLMDSYIKCIDEVNRVKKF